MFINTDYGRWRYVLLQLFLNVQECDARNDDSSTIAGFIKSFENVQQRDYILRYVISRS